MQNFWNERYSEHDHVYGTAPNVFFKQELDKLQPGKLLLPGDGEGRNGIYAATQGWDVTAFDSSDVAVKKGLHFAQEAGVTIHYQAIDAMAFEAQENSFDAIAMVFFHLPSAIRNDFHKKAMSMLKKGGTLIMEAYNPAQLQRDSGGPKDLDMLYTPEILQNDFGTMNITSLEMLTTELEEGDFHSGVSEVIRMVAVK